MNEKVFSILVCLMLLTQALLFSSPVLSPLLNAASAGSVFSQEDLTRQEFRLASQEKKIICYRRHKRHGAGRLERSIARTGGQPHRPRCHIRTLRVTITRAQTNLGEDANWQQTDAPGGGGGRDSGSRSQQWLKSAPISVQPELWFFGSSAFYKLYYNVSRTLCGGKEVFGYTLNPEKGVYAIEKKYRVKSPYAGDKILVKISAMDTLDVPIVYLSGPGGSNGNLHGEREFEVDGFPDREYTLTIASFSNKPIYGFISVEENNGAQPERADSGGSANYSGGGGSDSKGRVRK